MNVRRASWPDAVALGLCLLGACIVIGGLLVDPNGRTVAMNPGDDAFFQFVLVHGALVAGGQVDPFFTYAMNHPVGVNLMANTVVLGLGVPLAAVTLLLGAGFTFALILVLGLAGTAFGWYWLLSRHVVGSRLAAGFGGALCGFGPGMISHANGHPNWTAQFLVPPLILTVLRLTRPGHAVRDGLVLGLLVTYQAFINEEVLLYTALALGVFLLARWIVAPRSVRPAWWTMLGGLAVAALTAAVLLAYPLWRQFYGAQSYDGLPDSAGGIGADLGGFLNFPLLSIFGDTLHDDRLSSHSTEENTFFGWPLLLVLAVAVIGWLYRNPTVQALLITAVVFAIMALGSPLLVNGEKTEITLPWAALKRLPLLEHVVPTRFGLVVLAVLGVLLAYTVDAVLAAPQAPLVAPLRRLALVAIVLALLPLVPRQVPVARVPPAPDFIASGQWRDYVPEGRSLVTVPATNSRYRAALRWWAQSRGQFAFAAGYFLGPDPVTGKGMFGAPQRPTQQLFAKVEGSGQVPEVSERTRTELREDLAFWRAGALVLPAADEPSIRNHAALLDLMTQLLGPGEQIGGVTVWRAPG